MSSDPIEVLRELAASWHRAALNCHECGKPSQARVFRECAAQVTSALASLSAPKSEGEWVPVRRSDLLAWAQDWQRENDSGDDTDVVTPFDGYLLSAPKPESAEAVAWHTEDHLTDKSATTYDPAVRDRWIAKGWPVTPLYTAPPRPEASERVCPECRGSKTVFGGGGPAHRTNEYPCDTCRGTGRVPAPRPEASAPVGVEALVERWRTKKRDLSALGCANELEHALAQQPPAEPVSNPDKLPAAVDEEMAELLTEAEKHIETLHSIVGGEARHIVWKLIVRIRAALAGQQHGGPQE